MFGEVQVLDWGLVKSLGERWVYTGEVTSGDAQNLARFSITGFERE